MVTGEETMVILILLLIFAGASAMQHLLAYIRDRRCS